MKKTTIGFACLATGLLGYFLMPPADAQAPIPIPSVWLQSSSPGTTQTGNFNVNGIGMVGRMLVNTPGVGAQAEIASSTATGLYIPITPGGFNGVYVNGTANSSYPAVIGFATGQSNAGVWGGNQTTGSSGFLANGNDGLVATGAPAGYAGTLNGDVRISDQLIVNMGSIGTSRIETTESDINNVAIRAMAHGVTATPYTDGFYRPGADFGGRNGVIGHSNDFVGYGLVGVADGSSGRGLSAYATHTTGFNYGVVGGTDSGTNGYGVFSVGRTGASGTKSFRIDHPRDPENKYLLHYSMEGEKPLNTYQGEVTTDANGYATVALPDYFDDINRNAKVQLTVVDMSDNDDFALVKQVSPVQNASFRIRTSLPNTRVAWDVKAERWDLFVRAYGAPVVVDKPANEKGTYQHPELYGKGPERGMRQSNQVTPREVRTPSVIKTPKAIKGNGSVRIG